MFGELNSDVFLGSKIGRNQKCICGNGKKFKKCCMNSDLYKKLTSSDHIFDLISTDDTLQKGKKTIELHSDEFGNQLDNWELKNIKQSNQITLNKFDELDDQLQNQLRLIFNKRVIQNGGCYYNSLLISTLLNDVEKVNGFIETGHCLTSVIPIEQLTDDIWIVKTNVDEMNDYMKKLMGDVDLDDDFKFLYNTSNNMRLIKHSWNKIGDQHFDTTLGIEWMKKDSNTIDKKKYFEFQSNTIDQKHFVSNLLNLDFQMIWDGSKNLVKNMGVLDQKILDQVGSFNDGYRGSGKLDWICDGYDDVNEYQNIVLGNRV